MAFIYILGLAFFVGTTSALHFDNAVGASNSSITLLNYPSIVQVESLLPSGFWQHTCSATILNSRYVLTAASCFSGRGYQPYLRRIRAGANYRHAGGVVIYVEKENNYPRGNATDQNTDDISVVRVARPFIYSPYIRRTILPQAGSFIPNRVLLVQVGWGRGNSSYALRTSTLLTASESACSVNVGNQTSQAPRNLTAKILCGTNTDSFLNSNGDVGSPWMLNNLTIGVVSGINVGNSSWSGIISASVTAYTNWIVRTAV